MIFQKIKQIWKFLFEINNIAKIKLLILDVDGVLTDGHVPSKDGDVPISVRGQFKEKICLDAILVAVITSRDGKIIKKRLNELGITTIFDNQEYKMKAFNSCLKVWRR